MKLNNMKPITFLLVLLLPVVLYSQQGNEPDKKEDKPKKTDHSIGIGIKAGLNFANITQASQINSSSQTGFHVGLFLSPSSKSILGSRTELLYSLQGFDYATGQSTTGSVKLGYLMFAQLVAIHITKYVELQFGGQTSYLLTAKKDSTQPMTTGNAQIDQELSLYNRIDYGFAAGLEVHPAKGLLVAVRWNISLNSLYKGSYPSIPGTGTGTGSSSTGIDPKNNVIQLSIGYRF
jgi:hypothetical protein